MHPEIFGGYCLYLTSLILVSREAPYSPWKELRGQKIFNLIKVLLSHFKFKQTFIFLLFTFFGSQSLGANIASAVSKYHWICYWPVKNIFPRLENFILLRKFPVKTSHELSRKASKSYFEVISGLFNIWR